MPVLECAAGVALSVYCIIGICAASVYGSDTAGDVLVNQWLPGIYDGVFDALMALYLSISMAPIAVTLRYQLDRCVGGWVGWGDCEDVECFEYWGRGGQLGRVSGQGRMVRPVWGIFSWFLFKRLYYIRRNVSVGTCGSTSMMRVDDLYL
jgi:hypothetical protein